MSGYNKRDETDCQWLTEGVRCGALVAEKLPDSGLGYCQEHYPTVLSLRDWIYRASREATRFQNALKRRWRKR